ncbi:hypothetical protein BU17DRAFT_51516 [Hysterangium stoloniferum]|nr:hypothetical protein BU17DRAFT_51516 [Hysterangium stoloniferum]
MHSFGVTPKCPTCTRSVYAAEQVMGPGRKMYHKLCLKCTLCSRQLESHSLKEHDLEPYCSSCHIRNFGTKNLRSANFFPSSPPASPTRRTRSPPPTSPLTTATTLPATEEEEIDEDESPHEFGDVSPAATFSSSPFPRVTPPSTSLPPRTKSPFKADIPSTYVPRTYSARSISPVATGPSSAPTPGYIRTNVTGSPLRQSHTGASTVKRTHTGLGGTPTCPRCEKAVYFAEQVKASGRTWHQLCLSCTECSVLLDSTRITEKDGVVLCRNCYSKLHGPVGSGYALL